MTTKALAFWMNDYNLAFTKVFERLNELERRLNNILIPGKVIELNPENTKVKVKHGSCETPFIKWFSGAAGDISEYRAPSIGEQCLLLNLTGGDDTSACFALFGVDSLNYPLVSQNPAEHKVKYPNGTEITHNHELNELTVIMQSGTATLKAPDKVTVDTKELYCTGKINADDNIHSNADVSDKKSTMQTMRDKYNKHDHNKAVGPPTPNKME